MSHDPAPAPADPLLGPADVRALSGALGIRPTKTLGQNFVVDPGTVRKIVRTAGVTADDVVVEVGPGLGSLTLALLETGARVVAIEIDPVLAEALPVTVAARMPEAADRLLVVRSDAMDVTELPAFPGEGPAQPGALVANLPYNVAVPVLLTLLERIPSLRTGLVMVQAEVADRLAAPPGSRTYGVPSAKAAWYARAQRSATIGRTVFWPVPNVDSALVRIERRDPPGSRTYGVPSAKAAWYARAQRSATIGRTVFWPVPNVDSALVRLERREPPSSTASREEVFAVVDAAFSQRRKTLRSALASWAGSAEAAAAAVTAAGLDPTLRGERLGITDFARIAEHRGSDG